MPWALRQNGNPSGDHGASHGVVSCCLWQRGCKLSEFSVRQTARATQAAIVRSLSTSPHNHQKIVKYMYYIVCHIPVPKCCAINMTLQWLTKNA